MKVFKLSNTNETKLTTYSVVIDGEPGTFEVQSNVYSRKINNECSFMNISFTVDSKGKVIDVEVQVND